MHGHRGHLDTARGLALRNLRRTLGCAALAQFIVEHGTLAIQRLSAQAPLGVDAIDAIRQSELPRARRPRGLGLALDDQPLASDALAHWRDGIGRSAGRRGQSRQCQ